MQEVQVIKNGNLLVIGESPKLIVDLDSQQNYIEYEGKKIPYQREIAFSADLLSGKRKNVFRTALNYYYEQACRMVEGLKIAEQYRSLMN